MICSKHANAISKNPLLPQLHGKDRFEDTVADGRIVLKFPRTAEEPESSQNTGLYW
jgi:hypothetical protein